MDSQDYTYFIKSLESYNSTQALGKLRLHQGKEAGDQPVLLASYCLLPNHFHMLLRCNADGATSRYLQRLGGGYTMYFNQKYKRSGSLFQGTFKSKHVVSDQDLRQVFAYVTHNYRVHGIQDNTKYRSWVNETDSIVRGLTSNYSDAEQIKAVNIIKNLREGFE